jgi:hypothetical protein
MNDVLRALETAITEIEKDIPLPPSKGEFE